MAVTILAATLAACGSEPTWNAQPLWNGDVDGIQVASDTSHRLFLVWSSPVDGEKGGVWAAVAEPDGRWSAPALLSSTGMAARLGAGGGAAMAVWWEPDPPRLRWSRWAPAGWTAPQALAQGHRPSPAALSVDATGEAMAAWFDRPALVATTYGLDRGWQPHEVIASVSSSTDVYPYAVARAGTEAATLWVVTAFAQVRPGTSVTSFRRIDGAWRSALVGSVGAAAVTFDGSGTAVAVSATALPTLGRVPVRVAAFVGLPDGDWTEETLSANGVTNLALARSSTGEVAVLHGDRSDSAVFLRSDAAVELLYRPFDGRSFQTAESLHVASIADVRSLDSIALALSDGSALAAWFAGGRVWAAVKSGATWPVAQPVRTSADDCGAERWGQVVAAAAPARMTVAWSERGCGVPALWVSHRPRD